MDAGSSQGRGEGGRRRTDAKRRAGKAESLKTETLEFGNSVEPPGNARNTKIRCRRSEDGRQKQKAEILKTEIHFHFANFNIWQTGGGSNNIRLARLPHLSYGDSMKTLTIRLPDVLARRIEQESLTRRV